MQNFGPIFVVMLGAFIGFAALAVPLRPGFDPISGQPVTHPKQAAELSLGRRLAQAGFDISGKPISLPEAPAAEPSIFVRRLAEVAHAGGRHAGRLLGEEFVNDMVDLINRRILSNHDGRVCDPGLCDSYGGDCCTAPILERQVCGNDWESVGLTSPDERQAVCGTPYGVNAYTCCEPGPPWGLIIGLSVTGGVILFTIIGIVLCCLYCTCCKECCPECCGHPTPAPPPQQQVMNQGIPMQPVVQQAVAMPTGQPVNMGVVQPVTPQVPVADWIVEEFAFGTKFHPTTGAPIPQFNPSTGRQNC